MGLKNGTDARPHAARTESPSAAPPTRSHPPEAAHVIDPYRPRAGLHRRRLRLA